ncbi:MAG: DNA translocase FtsK 4TM domain-containing protein [Bacteroidales bacterium]|nr:DNA translocase FtsK 4TM domain-containing protein [Bacteroidales bacterium]MDD4067970.1 DNA translocase FtsK 4TM domain-containing protein [Bacteroidales bacterium]MDD4738873.1 DNA translocase FtsK 4TM domain-containing protein [Bacteroidales bacterium]
MKQEKKKKATTDDFKKDIKKKPTEKEKPIQMASSVIHSEVFVRVLGTFFVLLSVFLVFSFISFFISWTIDYNIVKSSSALDILIGNKDIKNWGGAIGAFLSHIMIVATFGVAAFGYVVIFSLIGLKLFGIIIRQFWRIIIYTLIIMVWLSAIIGYVIYFFNFDNYFELAGVVGISINSWFHAFAGKIGAVIILIFFSIILPMLMFGVKYSFVGKLFERKPKEKIAITEELSINEEILTEKENILEKEDEKEIKEKEITSNVLEFEVKSSKIERQEINNKDGLTDKEKEELLQFEAKASNVKSHSPGQFQIQPNNNQEAEKDLEINNKNLPNNVSSTANVDFKIETPNNIFKEELEPIEDDFVLEQSIKRNKINTTYDPKEDLSSFMLPSTEFLINYEEKNIEVKQEELVANKDKIVNTLKNYSIDISKIVATPGPTVTLYEIVPAPGIRISKIKNLEDDIALSLSALGIRIIAPIPGRGTIGIEVPNQHPQVVSMKTMLNSPEFQNCKYELPIAIGMTISNLPYVADLTKMPHLLMAGATGQGKSVGLNAIITSLLYKKHPAELKFVMVDPKKVELSLYTKIERHYLAKLPDSDEAIITDTRKVVRTLNSLCIEMDQRYDLLKNAQVKNIKEYNPKFCSRRLNPEEGHRYLPYIVLVIDEFADLIMTAGKEIEMPIARLAQLARAVGIHLIIATQRPSVNIITGIIKANFPARVAFRVTSKIDSRTILDASGADQLIGRGDLLLSVNNDMIRIQCALIDTQEIEQMAEFVGNQRGYPETFLLPEYIDENAEPNKEFDPRQIDDKFEEAARIIVALQHGSTSIIQRKLSLGYNRAGRIIDQLEAAGIVGPFEGSKAREVKIKTEVELDQLLREYLGK